jgi:thymidylate synthase
MQGSADLPLSTFPLIASNFGTSGREGVEMSKFLIAANNAVAWVSIMEYLLGEPDGKCFHLVTAISDPQTEFKGITQIVDALAKETGAISTMENANAIWPHVLAPPGQDFSKTMKRMKEFAAPLIKEANSKHADSYLERLLAWRSKEGGSTVPQLEKIIDRMKKEIDNPAPKSSAYDLAIFSAGLDPGYMSFPCLSHLSFKLDVSQQKVHLAGLYRNHHFISHGYGNFLGLGRLMRFVAAQVGCGVGELLCVSTHGDAELHRGRGRIRERVTQARTLLDEHLAAVGVQRESHFATQ